LRDQVSRFKLDRTETTQWKQDSSAAKAAGHAAGAP
jgi:hypothetical protein